jgi:hypothetical protein
MTRWQMRLLMLVFVGLPASAVAAQAAVQFRATAHVVVEADGVPSRAEASHKLPEPIRQAVEQHVLQLRFQPVVVDGVARTASTQVLLEACAVQQPGGELSLAIDYRSNGPGYSSGEARPTPLTYPRAAAEAAVEGTFDLVVRVETDGSAMVESIKRLRGNQRMFERDIRAWVEAQRYVPEQVDGVPVATRLTQHVDFYVFAPYREQRGLGSEEARRASQRCAAAGADGQPAHDPVVLDSPLKLLSSG